MKKIWIITLLWITDCSAVQLQDIQVTEAGDVQSLELARVQFMFDEKPLVTFVPERASQRISFIIPNSSVSGRFSHFVQQLQQWGTVTVAAITTPVSGVKISIQYDPEIVTYQSMETQSDQLVPVFVVRFFNKKLINNLEQKRKPLLELTLGQYHFLIRGKENETVCFSAACC